MAGKLIIVGGGRVGYYLAKTLKENNRDVVIIDNRKEICKEVADKLDIPVIWGDGTSVSVLESVGLKETDTFIAVTGKDENNLIACQTAKGLYNVKKTVAKANNPKNVSNIRELGVDIVISATDIIINMLEREVDHKAIKELMPLNDGTTAVYQIELPEDFTLSGVEILNIPFPDNTNIISVTRNGELIIPRGKTKLFSDDKLLIVSKEAEINEVRRTLRLKK